MLIYGFHAVSTRLKQNPDSVEAVYVDAARADARARRFVEHAQSCQVRVIPVERSRLDGMVGSRKHQGVVASLNEASVSVALSLDELLDAVDENLLVLVLDGIQDPRNLGACLRVADACGVKAVVAPRDRAAALTDSVRKAASGAAETVPVIQVTNLARALRELQEVGLTVVGADAKAQLDVFHTELSGPIAWVIGAEGQGLRRLTRETCDRLARIPMVGQLASLNASVAAAVCLYETLRRREG
jgi:23S rRNA (guanosine2251-2'-O)-methyltransferase